MKMTACTRSILVRLCVAAVCCASNATALSAPRQAPPVPAGVFAPPQTSLEFAFRLEVQVGAPLELGSIHGVRRRVIPIIGGNISGEGIQGEVLAGGADWQGIHEDSSAAIWAPLYAKDE